MIDSDIKLIKRFGDNYELFCYDSLNRLSFISDGIYLYKISEKCALFNLSYRQMTYPSKLKYLNSMCPNELSILSFTKINKRTLVRILHKETGVIKDRFLYGLDVKSCCEILLKNINRPETWVERCVAKFGDIFGFENTHYEHSMKNVIINCRVHGDFTTYPNKFENSEYGCPKCGKENKIGFLKSEYFNACVNKNNDGLLYLIRCYNDKEDFLKIGITSHNNLKKRFTTNSVMPYYYDEILLAYNNPEVIYNKEREIHKILKDYSYKPLISFGGETECFDISIKQKAISLIEELLVSLPDEIQS